MALGISPLNGTNQPAGSLPAPASLRLDGKELHIDPPGLPPLKGSGPSDEEPQSVIQVKSNITYEFVPTIVNGQHIPCKLGEGRFAKVYRVKQHGEGGELREAAMKVLHNRASHNHHKLFEQELLTLRGLSQVSKVHVLNILDVVRLAPTIMCGCGNIYQPYCPECGEFLLETRDGRDYPLLACPSPRCKYEISAGIIEIASHAARLTRWPAKRCCREGAHATEGTIINFVDRAAVIMELQDTRLDDFAERRREYVQQRFLQHSAQSSLGHSSRLFFGGSAKQHRDRAMALDKMLLMVQLSEAVAWLHSDMEIIHRDLTPENVMVDLGGDKSGGAQWHGDRLIDQRELLNDIVSHGSFGAKVIDFGLADKKEPTRHWYDEKDVGVAGVEKRPYFSPEAIHRIIRFNTPLTIEPGQTLFRIPAHLMNAPLSVQVGDIIAFEWDTNYDHDLRITAIEAGSEPDTYYARFEGTPPPLQQQRQFQLVLPLGEAHDVYSVGALFYYIMTEEHNLVQRLHSFVEGVQTYPCELTAPALLRRHGDSYAALRDAIPIPDRYWRDRLMELIMRAMVRGRHQSFSSTRSDSGAKAAQKLLWETKEVYRELQQEVLAEERITRVRQLAVGAAVMMIVTIAVALAILGVNTRLAAKNKANDAAHAKSVQEKVEALAAKEAEVRDANKKALAVEDKFAGCLTNVSSLKDANLEQQKALQKCNARIGRMESLRKPR